VEDEDNCREAVCELLRLYGHKVRIAGAGLAVVHMAFKWRPEAALIDLGLPLLDGLQVARRLRNDLGGWALLAAVTNRGRGEEDRRPCLGAGFDRFLAKPVDPEAVRSLLLEVRRAGALAAQTQEPLRPGAELSGELCAAADELRQRRREAKGPPGDR
jgi:DNA-binding response OmpR family regulator